jgi:GntP family gluconate:H+ symporter
MNPPALSFAFLGLTEDARLLVCAGAAIAAIVILIACFKLNSILALLLASIFLGLSAGQNPVAIAQSFQTGVGAVLGGVAMVIGLGSMLGKLLSESGGAEVIAARIVGAFSARRSDWAVLAAALLIGIPVFFPVGMVLLVPVVVAMSRRSGVPLMQLGLPLIASLSTMHACVPPHPGPMVVIEKLHADTGKTILYALLAGIPMAVLAGPLYGRWLVRRMDLSAPNCPQPAVPTARHGGTVTPPGFALAVFTLFLPILLMLLAARADVALPKDTPLRQWCDFVGGPLLSMTLAVVFALYSFGFARGFTAVRLGAFTNESLNGVAAMLLVIAAGGGFNQVLNDGGVAKAIVHYAERAQLPPLVLGWLVAALIRVAAGSSTVAITTAVGIVAPLAAGRKDVNVELLAVAMGAGSLIASHLNDGGFWIVKEMFGLSVAETFKTWTVVTIIASVVGLAMTLLMQAAWGAS